MRVATVLLFLGLSAGLAALALLGVSSPAMPWTDPDPRQAVDATHDGAKKAAAFLENALRAEPASPYSWVDLAEVYDETGRSDEADGLFERATELGPSSPPVLLRAAFHWLKSDRRERALRCTSRVLEISDQYDESVFSLYQRFQVPQATVIASGLGEASRAWRGYLKWLIAKDRPTVAADVWVALGKKGGHDQPSATAYLQYLIGKKRYTLIPSIWEGFAGKRADGYGRGAVIFDGSFEGTPTHSPVDWIIEAESQGVAAAREQGVAQEGEWSLAVRFPGKANVTWAGAKQLVVVRAGRYRLRAWLKTEHITTDRGPQLQVQDADSPSRLTARTEPARGTHDWARLELPFQVGPETAAILVGLVREPSHKFDSKIAGTIWIDGVEIVSDNNSLARAR